MASGIRATVEFEASAGCPIVELSDEYGTTIESMTANVCSSDCEESVVEFSIDGTSAGDVPFDPIFSHGDTDRYRVPLDDDVECPCKTLGAHGCPIARYVAENGRLTVVFHASDWEALQDVVTELADRFPSMTVKRFLRSPSGDAVHDHVLVDRSKLTTRQLEVLATAHEMGYFERPRRANATEVADVLDITPSTFSEHLAAAESKLIEDVL
jgi:predicted DNA binding protein